MQDEWVGDVWSEQTGRLSSWVMSIAEAVERAKERQHSTAQHSTAQHSTAQHSTAEHSTAQQCTAEQCRAKQITAQRSTAQHSTAQHRTARGTAQHSAESATAQHTPEQQDSLLEDSFVCLAQACSDCCVVAVVVVATRHVPVIATWLGT